VEVHAHLRDFGRGRRPASRPTVAIADEPLLLLLSTPWDSTQDRLRAGMAMERVLLAATAAGLAATFLDQALEHPELRWLLRDPLRGTGTPQVLLRIGYPTAEPTVTPRRPTDVVTG
jgi:nitroreductase